MFMYVSLSLQVYVCLFSLPVFMGLFSLPVFMFGSFKFTCVYVCVFNFTGLCMPF